MSEETGPENQYLIYGSYGYSGNLIAERAVQMGHRPVLAGRDPVRLKKQADRLGLASIALAIEDREKLDRTLESVPLILHCAGPFSRTYRGMIESALRTRTHYLDITGEHAVYRFCATADIQAKTAEVTLLPSVGFDVVPTDCLAVFLHQQLPTASHLNLGFNIIGSRGSRGTTKSGIENLGGAFPVRRDGEISHLPAGSGLRVIDFGNGPEPAVRIPWGDIYTAFHSTGIPNIEVFSAAHYPLRPVFYLTRFLSGLLRTRLVQRLLKTATALMPEGPSDAQLESGRCLVWGEVVDPTGRACSARLETPEAYKLTAHAAVAAVEKTLAGQAPTGYQTPGLAFGSEFIREIEGVSRVGPWWVE